MPSSEVTRLSAYHNFDAAVLEQVAAVAEAQRATNWFDARDGLPDTKIFTPLGGKPIEVLDITPKDGYDGVHVFHLPMGNGLDANMQLGIATIAAAEPTKRVIAAGNPGAPGQKSGRLRLRDFATVWQGDMRPTVDPLMQYLDRAGIERAMHSGGSCGADRAATAAAVAVNYDHEVTRLVLIEPASVEQRSLPRLAQQFAGSAAPMEGYVDAAASQAYYEARQIANIRGHGRLGAVGLFRTTNIAIARALSQDGFEGRVRAALDAHPDAPAAIWWGTESELATDGLMRGVTQRLVDTYGERVQATPLPGQRHALSCDIFLQAAIMLQSQRG